MPLANSIPFAAVVFGVIFLFTVIGTFVAMQSLFPSEEKKKALHNCQPEKTPSFTAVLITIEQFDGSIMHAWVDQCDYCPKQFNTYGDSFPVYG